MLQVYLAIGLLHCMLVTMIFGFIADEKANNKSSGGNPYDDMLNLVLERISNGDIVMISAFVGTAILLWPLHVTIELIGFCSAWRHSK